MRISEFLRASCVGALLFSPAMADDIEKVHEEALRALRENLGQANNDTSTPSVSSTASVKAPALSLDPEMVRQRAERDARIKAEAQERIAERERVQAARRQQYEQWVKERERLRQEQNAYDVNAAREMGRIKEETDQDILHATALKVLHHTDTHPGDASGSLPVATSPIQVAPEAATGPVTMTSAVPVPSSGSMMLAQADVDRIHAQALEALHQQQIQVAQPAASATPSTNAGPQPSPDLQRRLKQMQLELEQEQRDKQAASKTKGSSNVSNTSTPASTTSVTPSNPSPAVSDAYVKDLEERARQQQLTTPAPQVGISSGGAGVGSSSPGLDPATREILRRQDQEIARKMGSNSGNSASFQRTETPAPQGLTPDQDAQARQTLHQQEANAAANVSPAPASNTSAAPAPAKATKKTASPAAPSPTAHRVETDNSNVQYSKDLEERARQTLAERAQNQSTATVQAPAAPNTVIVPSAPAQSVTATPAPQPMPPPSAPAVRVNPTVTAAPAAASPDASSDVHARALDALNQIEAGTGPKTKQQRIKELTDLYRADKMSPAEYHQKRAQILAEPQ
jgi:hypothetical protein